MREVMQYAPSHGQRDLTRDQLEAILITCILLFGFEYWCGNLLDGGTHITGAVGLLRNHEARKAAEKGKERAEEEIGLLETMIQPLVELCADHHRRDVQNVEVAGLGSTTVGEDESRGDL